MTKKQLALGKACFSLAIILAYLAFVVFFFTYGRAAIQRVANELSEQKTMGGLGPALLLVLAIIPLIAFAVPAIMCLISSIGNFKGRGTKLVGFTVVGLVAEILAIVALGFLAIFFLGATQYDILSVVVTGAFAVLAVVSFVHSIIVLVQQKTAEE
ncbi:MAG: hypothetical protein IIX02_00455 [Clostridia bacterium]|nr:hypothetical protein [Clostridia bacterium]